MRLGLFAFPQTGNSLINFGDSAVIAFSDKSLVPGLVRQGISGQIDPQTSLSPPCQHLKPFHFCLRASDLTLDLILYF